MPHDSSFYGICSGHVFCKHRDGPLAPWRVSTLFLRLHTPCYQLSPNCRRAHDTRFWHQDDTWVRFPMHVSHPPQTSYPEQLRAKSDVPFRGLCLKSPQAQRGSASNRGKSHPEVTSWQEGFLVSWSNSWPLLWFPRLVLWDAPRKHPLGISTMPTRAKGPQENGNYTGIRGQQMHCVCWLRVSSSRREVHKMMILKRILRILRRRDETIKDKNI